MATFTYEPSFGPTSQRAPRILSVRFGDGYEQRGADGINTDLKKWTLTFRHRTITEIDNIESFFVTNNSAVTPFDWTAPRAGASSKYLCRSWTRTIDAPQVDSMTAVFEEVPNP